MGKKSILRSMFLGLTLLIGIALGATAQENPYYICDVNANNTVDLNLDVIGKGFTSVGGQWDYVNPSVVNATTYNPATDAIELDVSNIFVMVGKEPGVYKFVFTANSSNACIPQGEKRLATVVILETPKNVNQALALCPNESYTLDLKTVISSTLSTVTFFSNSAGTLSGDELTISGDFVGDLTVAYTVDHAGVTVCENTATITVSVSRDGEAPTYVGAGDVAYCVEEMPSTLNLSDQLSANAVSGTWSVTKNAGTGDAPTITGSTATFSNTAAGDVYQFTYNFPATSCYDAGTLSFTVSVKDDLSGELQSNTTVLCKSDNPSYILNMLVDGLGTSIELSSGVWSEISSPTGYGVDVTDGMFELADAGPGTYKYKFKVSSAANLCGLAGKSAILTINVVDANATQDARMELCIADLDGAAGNINLTSYINGLAGSTVTWTTTDSDITIVNGDEVAKTNLHATGIGTYKFYYSYDSGECGEATGSLYITVTDELDMEDITLEYCRPDMPAILDLKNAIGVDVPGTFAFTGTTNPNGKLSGTESKEFTETTGTTGAQTYTVQFTPTGGNCGAKPITITVIVKDTF